MSLLSTRHVRRIERELRAPAQLLIRNGDLVVAELVDSDLPGPWIDRPVPSDCSAVGLCLSLAGHRHLGAIVSRSGRSQSFVVVEGELRFGAGPSCRLVTDACRRRFGMATEPPMIGTDWYWISRWLLDIRAALDLVDRTAGVPERLLDLITVGGLHPAVDRDEFEGLDRSGITRFVIQRHRDHAFIADWACVRLDALADRRHHGHRLAVSLDDGAFSRWISACSIPLSLLAEPLVAGCSPLALELIGAVIADVVVRRGVGSP